MVGLMPTVEAKVLVADEVYVSLGERPDRVRECINAAAQAMGDVAAERGHVVRETPRLVDQRPTGLGFFELRFEAETGKR